MHVGDFVVVRAHRDASISEPLAVIALVLHALVVSDDADIDTLVVHVLDSVRQRVIRQVEHADEQ